MRRVFVFFLLVPLVFSGCILSESPEELERLTKEDPSFEKMILARNQARAQADAIKADLLARKKAMDAETGRLRGEYDAYAQAQQRQIDQLRASVQTHRQALRSQIETAEARLDAKLVEAEGYRKTLIDVRRMLKEGKGIQLSAKERQKWDERILMLTEKIGPIEDEIRELRLEIRLKKQKVQYLH